MQNSDIKGQRYLNDQSRESYQRDKRSEALWEQIRQTHQNNVGKWLKQRNQPGEAEDRL